MGDLKKEIEKLNKKYYKSDVILGRNIMTLANRINSSRANMFSGESDQVNNLENPGFPGVNTNYENLVGKYSSAYYKVENDFKIVKKIVKYPEFKDSVYILIIKYKKSGKYDIIEKKHGEELTETYGYKYQTEKLDSLKEGDRVQKGDVLYKSTSFDENMNYRLGIDAKVMYATDPLSIEDGIILSEDFVKKLAHIEYDKVSISLNDNDILLNWYGDKKHYKAFPNIGEKLIDSTLTGLRRIDYSRAFHDLKDENMRKELSSDTPFYVPFGEDKVVDIYIHCNRNIDDIEETPYNFQLLYYLKAQNKYFEKIYKFLKPIINKEKYSDDLAFMYSRVEKILNPEYVWEDVNKRVFGNIKLDFLIEKRINMPKGGKGCGRFGDKGVVTEVRKTEEMPFYENPDGSIVRADAVLNILGVGNRLNSSQLNEVDINFCKNCILYDMRYMTTYEEKENYLFKFLSIVSPKQEKKMKRYMDNLNTIGRKEFMDDIIDNGFSVEQPPMYGNADIDVLDKLFTEFNIEPKDVYVYKWGRKKKLLNKVIIAEKYFYKLKHHPKGKFSARSTSFINSKDQPSKSSTIKQNKGIYPTSSVKLGGMEATNLLINNNTEALSKYNMQYSSSPIARRAMNELYEGDIDVENIEIPENATNVNAEINNVLFKALGIEIDIE